MTKDGSAKKNKDFRKAQDSTWRAENIVDFSHDAIIGETLDGVIMTWNRGAERMFGYAAQEAVGKSVLFLLPVELKDEVPALMAKVRAGEVVPDRDSIRLHKDGTRIDVALSFSPILAADGTVVGASVVEREINLRKSAERRLRQTQLAVESSQDAIISESIGVIGETLDGIITTWNHGAEKMFGYSAEEAVGKSVVFLLPPDMKDDVHALLSRVRAGEAVADYESVRVHKDGSRIDVALSCSPIKDEAGNVVGASIVERNITERKKAELRIKELNEVRNKFISIISHQLRTPLTALNWNLESILNGDFGKLEETQRRFLQATHSASAEMTHRIHSLLTAMDVEEGRVRYETEDVSLGSLCAGVVNELMKKCELRNLSCVYTPPDVEVPTIYGDGKKIRAVIAAMVENAIDYTGEDGKITMALSVKGGFARFAVTDTGIGVPRSEQRLIFTRFFRASNASVMQPDAFGLGLFIAMHFIEQHHGKIGFESEEGKGSTFWFELPLK